MFGKKLFWGNFFRGKFFFHGPFFKKNFLSLKCWTEKNFESQNIGTKKSPLNADWFNCIYLIISHSHNKNLLVMRYFSHFIFYATRLFSHILITISWCEFYYKVPTVVKSIFSAYPFIKKIICNFSIFLYTIHLSSLLYFIILPYLSSKY